MSDFLPIQFMNDYPGNGACEIIDNPVEYMSSFLNYDFSKFSPRKDCYVCKSNTRGFNVSHQFNEAWESLDVGIRKNIISGNYFFILLGPTECWSLSHYDALFGFIKAHGLPAENIIVITGAQNITTSEWINKRKPSGLNILFGGSAWEDYFVKQRSSDNISYSNMLSRSHSYKKSFKFLCTNRRPRTHRIITIASLYANNLSETCLWSMQGIGDDNIEHIKTQTKHEIKNYYSDELILHQWAEHICNELPKLLPFEPKEPHGSLMHTYPHTEYLIHTSFFQIITESYYNKVGYGKFPLITEKTLKAIYFLQPFIMVSEAHTLESLKNLGYKTFEPWIDESYDREEDPAKRMELVMKEIKRLADMEFSELTDVLCEMEEVLKHNFNRLCYRRNENWSKTSSHQLVNLLR